MTCGGGAQDRSRAKAQVAENGGNECAGSATQSQSCNNYGCPGV